MSSYEVTIGENIDQIISLVRSQNHLVERFLKEFVAPPQCIGKSLSIEYRLEKQKLAIFESVNYYAKRLQIEKNNLFLILKLILLINRKEFYYKKTVFEDYSIDEWVGILTGCKSLFLLLKQFPSKSGINFTTGKIRVKQKDSREYKEEEIGYMSVSLFVDHLLGWETIALPTFEQSKVYVIDIDGRSNVKTLKEEKVDDFLRSEFGEPFFVEKRHSGNGVLVGVHAYFHSFEYINKPSCKKIEQYIFEEYDVRIELKGNGEFIRLPFSSSYYPKEVSLIDSIHKFIEHSELIRAKYSKTVHELNKHGECIRFKSPEDIEQYRAEMNKAKSRSDFTYGRGTRVETQIPLAFHTLHHNPTASFEDYFEICENWNDGTSRDMEKADGGEQDCAKIWFWAKEVFRNIGVTSSSATDNLVFENLFLPSEEEKASLMRQLKFGYRSLNWGETNSLREKVFLEDTYKVIEFLETTRIYRKEANYAYQEGFEFLDEGIPFGVKVQAMVAKSFNIRVDMRRIVRFLNRIGLLNLIKDANGYSYSYKNIRYAKHYKLPSNIIKFKFNSNSLYTSNPLSSSIFAPLIPSTSFLSNINNVVEFIGYPMRDIAKENNNMGAPPPKTFPFLVNTTK